MATERSTLWHLYSRFSDRGFNFAFFLNIALHSALVAGMAYLVARHAQDKTWSVSEDVVSDLLSMKFNFLPNSVVKIYGILLTWLTQDLALRRESLVPQNLTSIHDKTAAWMGEVKAAHSVMNQKWFRSSPFWRISGILLYLICIAVLGTASSSLVTYLWAPADPIWLHITQDLSQVTEPQVPYSYPILNALAVRDVFEVAGMAGVWNHIVFDPPQRLNEIIGNIAAVSFEVNCQALPHARQTSNVSVARDTSINSIRFPFHVDDRLQDVNLSLAFKTLSISEVRPVSSGGNLSSPTLLVASTIPVYDADAADASMSPLTPALTIPASDCSEGSCVAFSVQVLACDMKAVYQTISVDASSGVPTNSQELIDLLNNTWSNWTGPTTPQDSLQMTFPSFSVQSPLTNAYMDIALVDQTPVGYHNVTLLEQAVMDDLEVLDLKASSEATSIELWKLNLSLGRALAVVYWRAALRLNGLGASQPPATNASTNTRISQDGYEILVNPYGPIIGLVASSIALIVSVILTWPAPHTQEILQDQKVPTSLGVLQMFWRAGKLPGQAKLLADRVSDPDTSNLRVAGLTVKIPVKVNRPAAPLESVEAKPLIPSSVQSEHSTSVDRPSLSY